MNPGNIIGKSYQFSNTGGHLGTMIFNADGTIGGYNHPN